jgi:transposase
MLKKEKNKQLKYEFVCIESLVPQDHLLRRIDRHIDFSFIHDKVKDLYCPDNGRPAVDPVVLFKMLFIGYLFGIRSERRLVAETTVNMAYRWFLGYGIEDKIPDASTISQNRRRRFNGSGVYQEIFDEIVFQAMEHGMVGGKVLYTDSTHLKASANKNKFEEKEVRKNTRDYIADLDREIDEDRHRHGKGSLKPRGGGSGIKFSKVSTTDKDSGYMFREGKPVGFFYLDHRSVDGRRGIITDTYATSAAMHDSVPYLGRLDRQRSRFGFEVEAVGLDAGYFTASICKGLEDRGIYGVIGYRRPNHVKGYFRKREYRYDEVRDCYVCPGGQELRYSTTNRNGYREYRSDPSICSMCEHLGRCTRSRNHVKVLTRHVWEGSKERINRHRLTEYGKKIYARRKETVERSFADAKELHGHRYARMRGLSKVQEQCLLCAAAYNMKKIALYLSRGVSGPFNDIMRGVTGVVDTIIELFFLRPAYQTA